MISKFCWNNSIIYKSDLICNILGVIHSSHCVKSVRIWSYSGPHFPSFEINTKRYSISLRIQSKCGKIRTRITLNKDTFYAVCLTASMHYELRCLNLFTAFVQNFMTFVKSNVRINSFRLSNYHTHTFKLVIELIITEKLKRFRI